MSERERWIIYPLLFLALGAALRDKLAKQTRSENVVCQKIHLVDDQGRKQAELSGNSFQLGTANVRCASIQATQVNAQRLFQQGRPLVIPGGFQPGLVPGGGPQQLTLPQLMQILQGVQIRKIEPTPQVIPPQPGLPTQPGQPTEPSRPTQPGQPMEPGEPTESGQLAEPLEQPEEALPPTENPTLENSPQPTPAGA